MVPLGASRLLAWGHLLPLQISEAEARPLFLPRKVDPSEIPLLKYDHNLTYKFEPVAKGSIFRPKKGLSMGGASCYRDSPSLHFLKLQRESHINVIFVPVCSRQLRSMIVAHQNLLNSFALAGLYMPTFQMLKALPKM